MRRRLVALALCGFVAGAIALLGANGLVSVYHSREATGVMVGDCYHFNVGLNIGSPRTTFYFDEC